MIKKLYIFLFAFTVSVVACKSKAKTSQTSSEPSCKVVVNFASRGTGIDYTKYEKLTGILADKKVKYTEKVKGKEGEKEICIPLTELKAKEKNEFVEQLKTFEDKST